MHDGYAVIILAAGFSSRMRAGLKALLPIPPSDCKQFALSMLVETYRQAGIEHIYVVTGHEGLQVQEAARALGVACIHNADFIHGMFSSVLAGIDAVPCSHLFVHPVDIPLVRPLSIKCLHAASLEHPDHIYIPTFSGMEGHPILLPASSFTSIRQSNENLGLRGAIGGASIAHVPVPDSFILQDMDTDADYQKVCGLAASRGYLAPDEALELLRIMDIPIRGFAHARAVSLVASCFAKALNKKHKYGLDVDIAEAGGLVHDICKGQLHHEKAAGDLLRSFYLPKMAELVEQHRDCPLPEDKILAEKELVYIADKYMHCDRLVSLEERFGQKMQRYAGDAEQISAIKGRLERALATEAHLAQLLGQQPYELAKAVARKLHNDFTVVL